MSVVIDGTNGITTPAMGVGNQSPSNAGVTFPATAVASSDANTLDDYEEGTWTPTLNFDGNSVSMTYGAQAGRYTKVGNMVYLTGSITLTNKGTSSGGARLGSLPFGNATISNLLGCGSIYALNLDTARHIIFQVNYVVPSVSIQLKINGNSDADLTNSEVTNTSIFRFELFYQV